MSQHKNLGRKGGTVLQDIDVSWVNALRRTILTEIPNVAADIKTMRFSEDTRCYLHREFLAHRLLLTPMCFEPQEIETFEAPKYKFVIDVTNTTDKVLPVTSQDIQILDPEDKPYPPAFRNKVFPSSPISKDYVLLAYLKQNDKLNVTFRARRDTVAQNHAAFSPVSKCVHYFAVDEKLAAEQRQFAEDKTQFDVHDKYRLYSRNERGEPNKFVFEIESECRLTPEYLFQKALEVISHKLRRMTFDVEPLDHNTWNILILNETISTGYLLQSAILNNESDIIFAGVVQKHPLIPELSLKLQFKPERKTALQGVTEFFRNQCYVISDQIMKMSAKFT